jgi:hypothetical protein
MMNFIWSLWHRYKEWRWERKCIKHLGMKPTKMYVTKEQYDALIEAINKPPQYDEKIARVLSKKPPWDD